MFKEINENLKELREKEPSLMPENMTAEQFATADDSVITTLSTLPDEEILQEATQTEKIEDDERSKKDRKLERSRMMTKNWKHQVQEM